MTRNEVPLSRLSEKEIQICELVAKGYALARIGQKLGLAGGTVKLYLHRTIYPALGLRSQPELIRWWIENVELGERGDCRHCLLRQSVLTGADIPIENLKLAA